MAAFGHGQDNGGQPLPLRHCGTVRWYHVSRGYGCIRPDDGGADVFVHFSAIETDGFQALAERQRVAFLLTEGPRGRQALQVRPLPEAGGCD